MLAMDGGARIAQTAERWPSRTTNASNRVGRTRQITESAERVAPGRSRHGAAAPVPQSSMKYHANAATSPPIHHTSKLGSTLNAAGILVTDTTPPWPRSTRTTSIEARSSMAAMTAVIASVAAPHAQESPAGTGSPNVSVEAIRFDCPAPTRFIMTSVTAQLARARNQINGRPAIRSHHTGMSVECSPKSLSTSTMTRA